jgi:hypothetical protein
MPYFIILPKNLSPFKLEKLRGEESMGSSGTGRLTDYSGSGKNDEGGGGSSNVDKCNNSISEQLEEVARCAYFIAHNDVPSKGTPVRLALRTRLAVETQDGELLGYLPTAYNYLATCLQEGHQYEGSVQASASSTIPAILVTLYNLQS